eukprot:TRINITY_DN1203_c0_g2_i1.p1 TRINITY_DN1203_c0_g2~~TRINITY_DN1203_c0_g2_i1.p1  ORF type:complete len:623 (+),score=123.62 TRINITY_DN1203_c0_g2_i1:115-1983(+)
MAGTKRASFDSLLSNQDVTLLNLFQQANKIDLNTKIQLNHPPLFKFLSKPGIIQELVLIISAETEPPRFPAQSKRLQNNNKKQEAELVTLAVNIMTMESNEILDALISNNYLAMDSLFGFLNNPRPLTDHYAARMCRLIETMFRQRSSMMFEYVSKRPNLLRRFAHHIGTDSVYSFLHSLIRISTAASSQSSLDKLTKNLNPTSSYDANNSSLSRASVYSSLSPLNPKLEVPPKDQTQLPVSCEATPPVPRFQFGTNNQTNSAQQVTLQASHLEVLVDSLVDELEATEDVNNETFDNAVNLSCLLIESFSKVGKRFREASLVQRLAHRFFSFTEVGTCRKGALLLMKIIHRQSKSNEPSISVSSRPYKKEFVHERSVFTRACSLPPDYLFEILVYLNHVFYLLASSTAVPSVDDGKRAMGEILSTITSNLPCTPPSRRKFPGRPGGPYSKYQSPKMFAARFGETRLVLVQFVAGLLSTRYESVDNLLQMTGLIFLILDLFFHYQTLTVLHTLVVDRLIGEILLVPDHDELARTLVNEYLIHEKIISHCPVQISFATGASYQPQLLQIGLLLEENPSTRSILHKNGRWCTFYDSVLRQWLPLPSPPPSIQKTAIVDVLEYDVW